MLQRLGQSLLSLTLTSLCLSWEDKLSFPAGHPRDTDCSEFYPLSCPAQGSMEDGVAGAWASSQEDDGGSPGL
jgi:hypothetical protein